MSDAEKKYPRPRGGKVFLVVQQGGSTSEMYVQAFNTERQAKKYRKSADRATYATSEPIEVPFCALEQHETALMFAFEELVSAAGKLAAGW